MIKHIVLWKFFETANGKTKAENLHEAISLLYSMKKLIPGLLSFECRENCTDYSGSWDLALVCVFENKELLDLYQNHPAHVEVKKFLSTVRDQRAVVDFVMQPED